MKKKFEVTYVSNGGDKTTRRKMVVAEDQHEARRKVEAQGNKVVAVVYQGVA